MFGLELHTHSQQLDLDKYNTIISQERYEFVARDLFVRFKSYDIDLPLTLQKDQIFFGDYTFARLYIEDFCSCTLDLTYPIMFEGVVTNIKDKDKLGNMQNYFEYTLEKKWDFHSPLDSQTIGQPYNYEVLD